MRIVVIALTILCLAGCAETYRYFKSGSVGWALKKEIRDNHAKEVSIAKLTNFQWDELFLFGPYEPTSEICKQLALNTEECRNTITSESTDDAEMLMVFRHKGKVVHTEMHIRWHGDFTPVPDAPFTPTTAIFNVIANGKGANGGTLLRLSPVKP